jgi:DNA-binding response OmpR family regulator
MAKKDAPDLIILDLMLPGMNGFTVLQRLRETRRDMPVLIMTALGAEDEKLRGFGLGADDYVVKPCGLLEILARVRALLKRASAGGPPRNETRLGDLVIDFAARVVRQSGTELALRPKEFDLLAALVRHRGRVVSRAELLREVWGYAEGIESRTVETHLAALRERLGDDPQAPRYIVTVRRAGYRLMG